MDRERDATDLGLPGWAVLRGVDDESAEDVVDDSPAPLARVIEIRAAHGWVDRSAAPRLVRSCPRCMASPHRWCRPGGRRRSSAVPGFLHVERSEHPD